MNTDRPATGVCDLHRRPRAPLVVLRELIRRLRAARRGRIRVHELHHGPDGARLGREIAAFGTPDALVDFLDQGPGGHSPQITVNVARPFGLRGLTRREQEDLRRRLAARSATKS
jgi:hypothetical protein